jgi:DNA-binding protein HU-beta
MAKQAGSKAAAPKAAPAAKGKAKAAAPVTVTVKQIAADLAEKHDMPKRTVEALVNDLGASFAEHLKKGNKIRYSGIGVLEVRSRAARTGRNPATGAEIQIPASKKIAFRPAKELKESV